MRITFSVSGQPRGKTRPRLSKYGVYTPKETKEYEKTIRRAYITASKGQSFGNREVRVIVKAVYNRAKTNKARLPKVKPDIDNVVKAVLDGLNGAAYVDDKQVVKLYAYKVFTSDSEQPKIEVTVCDVET